MFQAKTAISTILPAVSAGAVLYLPEIHSKTGNYFPELRAADMSKATVVADIASSQHEDVGRVIAVDLASGRSWDASKEIAGAVLDVIFADYSRVPRWCIEFCEEHLGVGYVTRAERQAA